MWFYVRIAAYASLVVGYGLLMLLAVRHRMGSQRVQRLLQAVLLANVAFALGLGLMALFVGGEWWNYLWQRAANVGLVLLALLTAELTDAFVDRRVRRWPRHTASSLLLVAAIVLDALPLKVPDLSVPWLGISLGRVRFTSMLFLAAWASAVVPAWLTARAALQLTVGAKHRNRIRYLVACLVGLGLGDLLILVSRLPEMYVGFAARLLALSIVTFALLRYHLPDLRRLTLSAVRIILLTVITASVYILFLAAALFLSTASLNVSETVLLLSPLALAVVLAALLDVILGPRLHERFERTVLGRHYDPQKALRAYGQQVSVLLDLDRVAEVTLKWLWDTLRIQRAAFVLVRHYDRRMDLSVVCTMGEGGALQAAAPASMMFDAESRFVAHFSRQRRPLSQYDVDMLAWFQAMPDQERDWLKALGADLYVPILLDRVLVGLLALGPKEGAQPYSVEDQETLMLVAHQTGNAMENARLVGDLRSVQDDLNRLNSELAETNRQLQRLDRTKADFVTIASHELRTPLSQIFGYSDVLASLQVDQMDDPKMVGQFIDGISRGARRLKRVVDAMIDVSLIETGELKIEPYKMPLSVVVRNAMSTVERNAGMRNQQIILDDLSSLPYVEADGARLEQVFECLLANAIKFTPDGGTIRVSACIDEECVDLRVIDQGIGVDLDQQDLIFEKFYRPENPMLHSTDDVGFKGAGPGLGLAIAKGIVEAHGGRIWVESAGRDDVACPGSTFCVRLPLVLTVQS
ncbi:MAG: GAF domain-containing protein [Anaerolineae bacterium]|nr:GAF domain-containing protein [Anaerolineae bacterium]